ncbi:MAG TPA: hypothetical protein DD381_03210 [Lentisphaeria bacterium]|nr:MAG: hypothetical protein A2X47_03040 [Lentisphaerae bacterium GWF2_38_69]HBM15341.1 hypothetical protein [Lentisphaeria bacterium]
MNQNLHYEIHEFKFGKLKYIYPVISRRLGGLSVGINLVNYCNWDCVYCDAPKTVNNESPPQKIDLELLEKELNEVLTLIITHKFKIKSKLKSITVAGNGEPTLCNEIGEVFKIIANARKKYSLSSDVKTLLITNGSRLEEEIIQNAIRILATINGEVWFKIDSIIESSIKRINRTRVNAANILNSIEVISRICNLYIQTCFFKFNNTLPSEAETCEYLIFLSSIKNFIKGVYLYTSSRKPFASEEDVRIEPASLEYLQELNSKILQLGIKSKFFK